MPNSILERTHLSADTREIVTSEMVKSYLLSAEDEAKLRSFDEESWAWAFTIFGLLWAIFRSKAVTNDFIREKKQMLGNKTAIDLMFRDKEGLLSVKQLVEQLSGQ